jgi:hypothetical protein
MTWDCDGALELGKERLRIDEMVFVLTWQTVFVIGRK